MAVQASGTGLSSARSPRWRRGVPERAVRTSVRLPVAAGRLLVPARPAVCPAPAHRYGEHTRSPTPRRGRCPPGRNTWSGSPRYSYRYRSRSGARARRDGRIREPGDRLRMRLASACTASSPCRWTPWPPPRCRPRKSLPPLRFPTLLPGRPGSRPPLGCRRPVRRGRATGPPSRAGPPARRRRDDPDARGDAAGLLRQQLGRIGGTLRSHRRDHQYAGPGPGVHRSNADLPITSGDVAKAAGVTIRAVQLAFSATWAPPWKYLRRSGWTGRAGTGRRRSRGRHHGSRGGLPVGLVERRPVHCRVQRAIRRAALRHSAPG